MKEGALPSVSVVIPAHNAAVYLREALLSVKNQTFTDYEIIVVDDGSTDATARVVAEFSLPEQVGIRYFYQNSRGAAAARNYGVSESRGEYIAFLDADDMFLPQKLEKAVAFLTRYQQFAMVYTDMFVVDAQGRPVKKWLEGKKEYGQGRIFLKLLKECFFVPSAVVVRRLVLTEVGGFDPEIRSVEDIDLWLRIARKHKIGLIDEPLVQWRTHEYNVSRDLLLATQNAIKMYHKNLKLPGNGIWILFLLRRLAEKYFDLGYYELAAGNKRKACVNFVRSFVCWPSAKALTRFFLTSLPSGKIYALRRLRRGVK